MAETSFRIHPAIGIARVGNSEDYYLGPETMAGMPMSPSQKLRGGLPIKPGTENTTITSADLRDSEGRLKRQAARFRIYQYSNTAEQYPNGEGQEVQIGSVVDGKTVQDIIWTVHLANKKANSWKVIGAAPFANGTQDSYLRNDPFEGVSDPADPNRLTKLVIDAGPRALSASSQGTVHFDKSTEPSYGNAQTGTITPLSTYPASFPASDVSPGASPSSQPITTLGALTADSKGRLLVLGGYGLACGFDNQGAYAPDSSLDDNTDNDNWLDDTADGPVSAILVFDDGFRAVDSSAWVIATDPSYAPQTTNVVTLWDDLYTTWLEHLELQPELYNSGNYQSAFKPYFDTDVQPILQAAALQKWNTSLPPQAVAAHDNLLTLTAQGPDFMIMNFIRDPNNDASETIGSPLMPLSLGDLDKSFLSLTTTQYFFMQQWSHFKCTTTLTSPLGPGEALDKTVLFNCLGGRFSPGIEMSFIVRDPKLYRSDWKKPEVGPFRINMEPLDYSTATPDTPFLGVGYVPQQANPVPVQPGDLVKFMAIPWHTDYNSCATHLPTPNPGGKLTYGNIDAATSKEGTVNTFLYASWPAQRPVAVYTYEDVNANEGKWPVRPRYSVRGQGTEALDSGGNHNPSDEFEGPATQVGRYQDRKGFVLNWHRIGVVIQGPAIEGYPADPVEASDGSLGFLTDFYLEVASQFGQDHSNLVEYWPNTAIDKLYPPPPPKSSS